MKSICKYFISFFIVSLLLVSSVFGQQTFDKTIAKRLARYWYLTPQEKVYLHTDKPYYNAGETIWLKAYLLNAATHRFDTKSNFIYVELINISDSVFSRIKIRKNSYGFSGNIYLRPDIQSGQYTLRAYNSWMQNSPDYFFHKKITIGNSIDDRVNCKSNFTLLENGEIKVELTFANQFNTAFPEKIVSISKEWIKNNQKPKQIVSSESGKVSIRIQPDTSSSAKKFLDIEVSELNFKKRILIPEMSKDFDIAFLPESAVFLDNKMQTIGFKAVGLDGLSVDVEGTVYNNKDEELLVFKSLHKGMGKINLMTNPNESYYAIVKSSEGVEKKVLLPPTQTEGIGLKLISNRDNIIYQINNQTNIELSSLYLMAHVRGIVYFVSPIAEAQGQISEDILPAGVTCFSVVDTLGNTWCERLFFNRNFQKSNIAFATDKEEYAKRELVNLEFSVTDYKNEPVVGLFSLSITDSKLVRQDSLAMNIENYLLLSSDLKGYIEEPGAYFVDNSALTKEKTDALMLTQGWRRFNTAEILKEKYPENKYYLEAGQTVSGRVINVFKNPVVDREVTMLSTYKNRRNTTVTDSIGRFILDGVEFPDSTNLVLKAKSLSKLVDVIIEPDMDKFPEVKTDLISEKPEELAISDDYLFFSKEKYYTEGGLMVVGLEEFLVNGKEKEIVHKNPAYAAMAEDFIIGDKLESMIGMSILDVIATFSGVQVYGEEISVRGSTGNPLFLINEIETDRIEDILNINASDIDAIYLFKGVSTTMFGSSGGNGVIAIELKEGLNFERTSKSSLATIMPLGFQKPKEFYVPKYEVDSILMDKKADLRSTVYWNPNLISDKSGKIKVSFYTADKANNYSVELEGIGVNAEICRYKGIIRRED